MCPNSRQYTTKKWIQQYTHSCETGRVPQLKLTTTHAHAMIIESIQKHKSVKDEEVQGIITILTQQIGMLLQLKKET